MGIAQEIQGNYIGGSRRTLKKEPIGFPSLCIPVLVILGDDEPKEKFFEIMLLEGLP
jgi:hypothetical protein